MTQEVTANKEKVFQVLIKGEEIEKIYAVRENLQKSSSLSISDSHVLRILISEGLKKFCPEP